MKTMRSEVLPLGGAIVLLVTTLGLGCKREAPAAADGAATQAAPQASAPAEARAPLTEAAATEVGERAATAVMSHLMARVKKAMAEGGPEHAIDVCSEVALPLTAEIAKTQTRGVEVKRTSSRLRNPKNAPDALERLALDHFETADPAKLPAELVQKVDDGFRYYRPIVVQPACLACHGDRAAMSPKVLSKLQERYPNDQATGYKAGDLRGIIRVSVPEAAGQGG
jgi:mono/diheme cytochrome c family protein